MDQDPYVFGPPKSGCVIVCTDPDLDSDRGADPFIQCGGSGMFIPSPGFDFFPSRIPDPNCLHPGSRILIQEFKYFNPQKSKKMISKLLKKYDPGCSSRIPDPGVKKHPIPDPDPQHCFYYPIIPLYDFLSLKM